MSKSAMPVRHIGDAALESGRGHRSRRFTVATHERSREADAPAERVWRIWSDPSTWPSWNPDVVSISLDGPFAAGTTGKMTTKAGGTHTIRLAEVQEGRSFQLETAPVPLATFTFRCVV